MAVVSMSVWRPVRGRTAEFAAQVGQAKAIHERLGASAGIWQPVAGGQAGTFTYTLMFDDMAAYGNFAKASAEDPEWMSFWMGIQGDPTAEAVETILASEVPLG